MPHHIPIAPPSRKQARCSPLAALLVFLLFAGGLAMSACACSLPVFRFALDRWPADPFRLVVSEQDAKEPAVTKFLRNFGADSGLNLEIQRSAEGPSRLFRPPQGNAAETTVWQGTVTERWLQSLGEPAAGAEIVRRLLAGDSAVWVLVESGDAAADNAAAASLEKRLAYLQQAIEIPPADPNDLSSRPGPGPKLAVRFSLLRLRAADVSKEDAESLFRATLAGPQSGLAATNHPWFAAVFGRGRVLGAWPAADFGTEQIDEICIFLSGACSCQVKRQNPGWDLLLKVDWEERLRAIGLARDPSAQGAASSLPSTSTEAPPASPAPVPETVRFEPQAAPATAEPAEARWLRNMAGKGVAIPLVVLPALLLALSARKRLKNKSLRK
jgi:hypothetical protein